MPRMQIADGAILRLEVDVFPDGRVHLQSLCGVDTKFEDVANAFRAAVKDLGNEIKNRAKCPFHPDHPDNPMRPTK